MICSQEAFPIYNDLYLSELKAFFMYPLFHWLDNISHCLVPNIVV